MSNEKIMSIEEEINLVYNLLVHPAGFDIDIAGLLWVRRYEYPQWAVEWENCSNDNFDKKISVKEFADAKDAAKFFVEKRRQLCLGLDFEKDFSKEK